MSRIGDTRAARRARLRGVALLLVLGALAVVAVGAASLAALAAQARAGRRLDRMEELASALLDAAQEPVSDWLERESPTLVLPPDAAAPGATVLELEWEVAGVPVSVSAVAFDECGMVPWEHVRAGSPLRLALPPEVAAAVDAAELAEGESPGLDAVPVADGLRRYPTRADVPVPGASGDSAGGPVPCVGALVATHASATARVNVNTAPAALVEAAFRAAGRTGAETVLANRAAGRMTPAPETLSGSAAPSPPPSSPSGGRGPARDAGRDATRVALTASGDVWAVRIDVRAGELRRAWWELRRRESGGWRCVQRLAVDG